MQANLPLAPPPLVPIVTNTRTLALPWRSTPRLQIPKCSPIKSDAAVAHDGSVVDYSSVTSVFPAEACEIVGGEACAVEMHPEVKPKTAATSNRASAASEPIDREYLEYDGPKTVFLAEACDDLGGEFCEPDYQREVS